VSSTSVDFYNRGSIKITKSVFEVGTTQFQIRNISQTNIAKVLPDRKGPIIMCVIGGLCLLSGQAMPILLGLACIGGGVWWWISQKTLYTIMLMTNSGQDTKSYSSYDLSEITEIREALNAAMH
jgi:hypothetical protein